MTDDTEHEVLQRGTAVLADGADADDGPTLVNGVAIGEDDITTGMSGKRTIWPGETLREAAEKLIGKPIVRNHPDPEAPQPPIEAVIGEVTDARYQAGVGLLWQGELDDADIAQQVERGRADVSPVMARELGDYDDEQDAHIATEIHAFRDLGVVSQGAAASNAIEPSTGEAAMDAEALAGVFGGGDSGSASESTQDDDPRTGASTGRSPTDEEVFMTEDDLTDKERELLAQTRQLDDPVVMPAETAERLDDADELLAAAEGIDSPTVVAEAEYEEQQEHLSDLEAMMDQRLTEETGLKETTVEAMSFDAKAAEFEDEEGEFTAEALVQTPETGSTGEGTGPSSGSADEELTEDEEERLEQLKDEIEFWDGRESMDNYVESLREEREALTGGN